MYCISTCVEGLIETTRNLSTGHDFDGVRGGAVG
jgi:hypothetical protein